MQQLPILAQWISFGATILIPFIVAVIAILQWKTAKEKLVLDLFEKRFAVFMDVRTIASEAVQIGKLSDAGMANEVLARGRFLFGEDMQLKLREFHALTGKHVTGEPEANLKLNIKFEEMLPIFESYLRMEKKVPKWW